MSDTELLLECLNEISISRHVFFLGKWNVKLAKISCKLILIEDFEKYSGLGLDGIK